jgi:hypothetical protein
MIRRGRILNFRGPSLVEMIGIGSWKMFVNVVNKHLFVLFIYFGLPTQREGETNNFDCWPSKSIPIKVM